MKVYFSEDQLQHNPPTFLVAGAPQPCPEKPERAERLSAAVREAGHEIVEPNPCGLAPAAAIHTPAYLDFLKVAYDKWQTVAGSSDVVIPNVHPYRRDDRYPAAIVGRAGYHMLDTACPIGPGTYEAVLASLSSAISAADHVLSASNLNANHRAYALCRPPGHHAYADACAGFCFVNNSAAVAQHLLQRVQRVAIVDVDVHHGNGTQEIFYRRRDVMTVSLHRDPMAYYPFHHGHADEEGEADGLGFNLNVPLPKGTDDDAFVAALGKALDRVTAYQPEALVVALGLDAAEQDPLQGMAITTPGFRRIGAALGQFAKALDIPTVIVQEGGYLCDALGANLVSTLTGFEAG